LAAQKESQSAWYTESREKSKILRSITDLLSPEIFQGFVAKENDLHLSFQTTDRIDLVATELLSLLGPTDQHASPVGTLDNEHAWLQLGDKGVLRSYPSCCKPGDLCCFLLLVHPTHIVTRLYIYVVIVSLNADLSTCVMDALVGTRPTTGIRFTPPDDLPPTWSYNNGKMKARRFIEETHVSQYGHQRKTRQIEVNHILY
jgi:hypothetical protein